MIRSAGILTLLLATAAQASPDEREATKAIVWTYPGELPQGLLSGGLEWRLSEAWTVAAGLSAGGSAPWTAPGVGVFAATVRGALHAGVAWHFLGTALSGIFVGPRLEVGGASVRSSSGGPEHTSRQLHLRGELLVGATAQAFAGLSLQLAVALGGTWQTASGVVATPDGPEQVGGHAVGIGPRLHLALGWSF